MSGVSVNLLPHAASKVLGTPLAIDPRKLSVILAAVGPRFGLEAPGDVPVMFEDPCDREEPEGPPANVAVLAIVGTLFARGRGVRAYSGLSGYQQIRASLDEAIEDDEIDGIVLDVDSCGGECAGLFDLADAIHAASQKKPVWAVANHNAFSAAYTLASAASKLYVTRTSGVGSIGVVAVHVDRSGANRDMGLSYSYVHAGEKKVDGNPDEPLSDRARAATQAEVDRIYGLLIETVAKHGRLTAEQARATEAGLFYGEDAVKAGLADKVGTLADAVRDMDRSIRRDRAESPFSDSRFPVGVMGGL